MVRRGLQRVEHVQDRTGQQAAHQAGQNVTADETYGKTWGHWCATTDNYGADRKWVLLKPIPIDLDDEEEADTASPAAASGSKS